MILLEETLTQFLEHLPTGTKGLVVLFFIIYTFFNGKKWIDEARERRAKRLAEQDAALNKSETFYQEQYNLIKEEKTRIEEELKEVREENSKAIADLNTKVSSLESKLVAANQHIDLILAFLKGEDIKSIMTGALINLKDKKNE